MSTTLLGPTSLSVVAVTGTDRLTYLEAVTTQHLTDLAPGEVRGAMHLDANGGPVAVFDVVAEDDQLLLLVPDALTETVLKVLGGRTFLSDATFRHLDDQEVRALRGDDVDRVADAHGLRVDAGSARRQGAVALVGRPHGLDLIGTAADLDAIASALGDDVVPGDASAVRAADIAAGIPAWDAEIRPPHLPEELGLLPSHVHLAKGCYPGQEAVARMWMLGRPRRALASVVVHGDVAPGWTVGTGKRKAEVTSVAGAVALAFVPSDAAAGDRFEDEGGNAIEVRTLVGTDLPVPGHDPAVKRRRDQRAAAAAERAGTADATE